MLAVFLTDCFKNDFGMGSVAATNKAATMCGVCGNTVRNWCQKLDSSGKFEEKRGHHHRESILNDENCSELARTWIKQNNYKKGEPNMTSTSFCHWVNNCLHPRVTLGPDLPRKISVGTAAR